MVIHPYFFYLLNYLFHAVSLVKLAAGVRIYAQSPSTDVTIVNGVARVCMGETDVLELDKYCIHEIVERCM